METYSRYVSSLCELLNLLYALFQSHELKNIPEYYFMLVSRTNGEVIISYNGKLSEFMEYIITYVKKKNNMLFQPMVIVIKNKLMDDFY